MMWSSLISILLLLPLVINAQGAVDTNEYLKNEKTLALLDLTTESISRAKSLIPNCTHSKPSTISGCGTREKSIAFLEIATNLVSKIKERYPKCVETKTFLLHQRPIDCTEVLENGHNRSGVYTIWPRSRLFYNKSLDVYCDMDTDGGGWTVIQRRGGFGNQLNFTKTWAQYKTGFGNITQDFWIGNDNIYALSNQGTYKIRFDLEDALGDTKYAVYDTFWVENENANYILNIGKYSGNAGDAMDRHNKSRFIIGNMYEVLDEQCGVNKPGGWWHVSCADSNLNGIRLPGKTGSQGIFWYPWKSYESLSKTEMKLRRK